MDTPKQIQFLNWLEMQIMLMDFKEEYQKKEKLKKENKTLKKVKNSIKQL